MDLRELRIGVNVDSNGAIGEIKAINKELDKTSSSAEQVEKAAQTLGNKIKASIGRGGGGLESFGNSLTSIGSNMQATGLKMSLATAPLSIAMKRSKDNVLALSGEIGKVMTLADKDILPQDKLEKTIRSMSDDVNIMQEEIADGFYEALSSGVDSEQVTDFVKANAKLTKAGFTTMGTAIDATTTVLNAYGNEAYKVSKIHDIFVKTQDKGKITVDELASSIGRVIPTAAAAGVNLDQLGAAYSILTAKGQNAQIATTTLNSLLQELSTSGSKSNKALIQSTGKSFQELMQNGEDIEYVLTKVNDVAESAGLSLADMFGNANASKAANSLFGSGFAAMRDVMNNAAGTTDANYEEIQNTDAEQYKKTMNEIRNTGMDVAKDMLPLMKDLANVMKSLSGIYNSFGEVGRKRIAKGLAGMMIGGPALTTFGTGFKILGGGFKKLGQFMKFLSGDGKAATAGLGQVADAASEVAGVGVTAGKAVSGTADGLSLVQKTAAAASGSLGALSAVLGGLAAGYGVYKGLDYLREKRVKREKVRQEKYVDSYMRKINRPIGYSPKPHKLGLTEVPYDNYLASLHKGERVLTKEEARDYSDQKYRAPSENHTHIEPTITININAQGNQEPIRIARECERAIDEYFRKLRLQRV